MTTNAFYSAERNNDCLDFDSPVNSEDELPQLEEPVVDVDRHGMGSSDMRIPILASAGALAKTLPDRCLLVARQKALIT